MIGIPDCLPGMHSHVNRTTADAFGSAYHIRIYVSIAMRTTSRMAIHPFLYALRRNKKQVPWKDPEILLNEL